MLCLRTQSWGLRMTCFRRVINAILLFSMFALASSAQNARRLAEQTLPSVALLAMEDASGHPLSVGSGFVTMPGYVVTNLHVIEGAARAHAKIWSKEENYDVEGVSAVDAIHDLVILSVPGLAPPVLPLGDSTDVAIGDEVYAVANPKNSEKAFSQGVVCGIRRAGSDALLQITAPILPAGSGGPVLDGKGNVIGVSSASLLRGEALNFAIPVVYLRDLLLQVEKDPMPLSSARSSSKSPLYRGAGCYLG